MAAEYVDDDVQKTLQDVGSKRNEVLTKAQTYKDAAAKRSKLLADSKEYQEFRRDAGELRAWMQEKLEVLKDTNVIEPANVEGKSQKAEALKAELEATKKALKGLNDHGEEMMNRGHFAADNIQDILDDLNGLYQQLMSKMGERDEKLVDTKKLSDFYTMCDEIMVWINEKEHLVQSITDEIASNPYKYNILDKKHSDLEKEVKNHQIEIDNMCEEAEVLERRMPQEKDKVLARRDEILEGMQNLHNLSLEAKAKIESAKQIQKFLKDSDEMADFLREKKAQTPLDNLGEDLEETKALQRRHQNVERDLSAISNGVKDLFSTADTLATEQPNFEEEILSRKNKIMQNWAEIQEITQKRRKLLTLQYEWLLFISLHDGCVDWIREKTRELEDEPLATTTAGAVEMLNGLENVHLRQIQAETEEVTKCSDLANQLIEKEHPKTEMVKDMRDKLLNLMSSLQDLYEETKIKYNQCLDLQHLKEDTEQCESSLKKFEMVLQHADLGDSVDEVEALIIKLESQLNTKFNSQKEKLSQLKEISEKMVDDDHYATEEIENMVEKLFEYNSSLHEKYVIYRKRLDFSLNYHIFTRDSDEYLQWLIDRHRVISTDESYRDPSDLLGKVQAIKLLKAEVVTYQEKIHQLYQLGKQMTEDEDNQSDEELEQCLERIKAKLNALDGNMELLNDEVLIREGRLKDALDAQKYYRSAEEVEFWMSTTDAKLASREPGKDLNSCHKLLKQQELIENDIRDRRTTIEDLYTLSKAFYDADHFDKVNIKARQDSLQKRYVDLKEPMKERREWLEDAMRLHQFYRDVEDVQLWMASNKPLIGNVSIGKDYVGALKLKRKHAQLMNEMKKFKPQMEEVLATADQLMDDDHFASETIEAEKRKVVDEWDNLEKLGDSREKVLDNSIASHSYLMEANEAEEWLREKQDNLDSKNMQAWPKNIDDLLSESKRHEKSASEIEKFRTTVDKLAEKAKECETTDPQILAATPIRRALVIIGYNAAGQARHLSVNQKEVVTILDEFPNDLFKVENDDGLRGLVPKHHLKEETEASLVGSRDVVEDIHRSVREKQQNIENSFNELSKGLKDREKKLNDRIRMSQLMTKAASLRAWLGAKHDKKIIDGQLNPNDDKAMNKALKNAGNFVKQLDSNKAEITAISQEISMLGEGDPELEEEVIQTVDNVNALESATTYLLDKVSAEAAQLENAHEVKQYLRDCDELVDRIQEKDSSLVVGFYGGDINSNAILANKHVAFEADVAKLEEAAKELRKRAGPLAEAHPEAKDEIRDKLMKVGNKLNELQQKSDEHKERLNEMSDYFKFDEEFKDIVNWIDGMNELLGNDLANDLGSAQAQLERHQDLMGEIDARAPQIRRIIELLRTLQDHPQYDKIVEKVRQIDNDMKTLRKNYDDRESLLEKNVQYQEMNKDYNQNEQWIMDREDKLEDETDIPSKHEDIDKIVNYQETRIIETLTRIEDLLVLNFRTPELEAKKRELQSKWVEIRGKLFKKKEEMIHEKSVVATIEDLDELQNWVDMRIPTAEDDSLQGFTNIQRKNEKQKAFHAEVMANKDHVDSFKELVEVKLQSNKTTEEQKRLLEQKLKKMTEKFEYLVQITTTKTVKLKEANRQRLYYTAYEDFKFWLSSVEVQLQETNYGKDLATVSNQRKKHAYFEEGVRLHADQLRDLNTLADECIAARQFDPEEIENKREDVNIRFEHVKELSRERKRILDEAFNFHKLLSDIAMEESWIMEKQNVLSKSTDYGQTLPGVENLIKRHNRLKTEMTSHEQVTQRLKPTVDEILEKKLIGCQVVQSRFTSLLEQWENFSGHAEQREKYLTQSRLFHELVRDVEEVRMWISEKKVLIDNEDFGDNLATVAGLRKKHDMLWKDVDYHEAKGQLLNERADKLIEDGNLQENSIKYSIEVMWTDFKSLRALWEDRDDKLQENLAYLQFIWKTDVIDSWINEKKLIIENDDIWRDPIKTMSDVIVFLHRHDTFKRSLDAFNNDNVRLISDLHHRLMNPSAASDSKDGIAFEGNFDKYSKERISHSYKTIMDRWESLNQKSNGRREELEKAKEYYQAIEDKYLLFAKKASGFNSWFENSEDDLREPLKCNSIEEVQAMIKIHQEFMDSLEVAKAALDELQQLDNDINQPHKQNNPYTWFTMDAINETWNNLLQRARVRKRELEDERKVQNAKEELRKQFAREANAFYDWLVMSRVHVMEQTGTIEEQLGELRKVAVDVKKQKSRLKTVEELGRRMEDSMIFDNRHSEHTTLGLSQAWEQLDQLCLNMQNNLQAQLGAKESSGLTESTLSDFTKMFRHHDKEKVGVLNHDDLKSCLRALGYDLPMLEEGIKDPEFEEILDYVDKERRGFVTLTDYMHFLIMKETDNVSSKEEVVQAFETLDTDKQSYLTIQELRSQLDPETSAYCIANMKTYVDEKGCKVENGMDYREFCDRIFAK